MGLSQYLRTRLVLDLMFKPITTPFIHVGMRSRLEWDLLEVLKVSTAVGGTAYLIPSHSIKGVLRRVSEYVAKASATGKGLENALMRAHCEVEGEGIRHVCSGDKDLSLINDYVRNVLNNRSNARKYIPEDSIDEVRGKFEVGGIRGVIEVEPIVAIKCPICRLYGSLGLGGKVYVRDVVIKGSEVNILTRTGIERPTSKVREGTLFSVEALTLPKLELTLIIDNVAPRTTEALIIVGTLEWLSKIGLSIGGMKSVGMGHYVLDPKESRGYLIDYENISDEEFIKALANPLDYVKECGVTIDYLIKVLSGG